MNLLQSMVNGLAELFPKTNIYVNDVEQGLVEPCFFVKIIQTEMRRELAERYRMRNLVNVVYMDSKGGQSKLLEIQQKLLLGLTRVILGQGQRESYKVTGGIYQEHPDCIIRDKEVIYTAWYNYTVKFPVEQDPYMQVKDIIHYTTEEPYKEETKKVNPGMWKSPPWPKEPTKVYPKLNPRDERYRDQHKGKMWSIIGYNDRYDLEKKKYEEEMMQEKELETWPRKPRKQSRK